MILYHVPDRAYVVIELAAPGYVEVLGHSDLHALHIIPVPDRFQEGVGEAEEE